MLLLAVSPYHKVRSFYCFFKPATLFTTRPQDGVKGTRGYLRRSMMSPVTRRTEIYLLLLFNFRRLILFGHRSCYSVHQTRTGPSLLVEKRPSVV